MPRKLGASKGRVDVETLEIEQWLQSLRREGLMKLREIAHARTGDKGNIINISLIAYHEFTYPLLVKHVTSERVSRLFALLVTAEVERYCVMGLGALNFVLHRPRTESVTRSLSLDAHGKGLGFVLLNLDIDCETVQREVDE
jgi:hypothetical protein